jgi:putative ABC transport system ATP-binding protein
MVAPLVCHDLTKTYNRGGVAEAALTGVSLQFPTAQCCALLGPSGSGKTTFLCIVGGLLSPSRGTVEIDGIQVNYARRSQLAHLRRRQIGFEFQHAQLLPFLSVYDNLRIVAANSGMRAGEFKARINHLLERLGIGPYANRMPHKLSGGQRQRVSIARAVLHRPRIILADEPTAALDWENGQAAVRLLIEQARDDCALLIVVTHDTRLITHFDRAIQLESGKVLHV